MAKKLSEWLSELGSHEIYASDSLGLNFTEETGEPVCWHDSTPKEMRARIEARGLGGHLDGNAPAIAGYEIAEALAQKYAKYLSPAMGRGRRFWDCVEALKKLGK